MITQLKIATLGLLFITSCSENKEKTMDTEKTNTEQKGEVSTNETESITMNSQTGSLGAFSMSLNVKDLAVSKKFYENLGFVSFGGDMEMNYLIMKNGNTLIGLFQGMFDANIITFNPGWDESAKNLNEFTDIRSIQQNLKDSNINLDMEADTSTTGPASIMLKDPDGNVILIDQHR